MSDIKAEPVAWGMSKKNRIVDCIRGAIIDCITPDEHARKEGGYTIPLYTAEQVKAEILAERERCAQAVSAEIIGTAGSTVWDDICQRMAEVIRKEPT